MPLMSWKDDYSVKIAIIDQQHKKLIDLLNRMHDSMKGGRGKEAVGSILTELVDYAGSHFKTEEGLMQTHGYPALEIHRLEHVTLTKKVLAFKADFDAGITSGTIDVLNFLKGWLDHHILGTDKHYSQFFVGKGVK